MTPLSQWEQAEIRLGQQGAEQLSCRRCQLEIDIDIDMIRLLLSPSELAIRSRHLRSAPLSTIAVAAHLSVIVLRHGDNHPMGSP